MSDLPLVLCVDDEPQVLGGLELILRRRFTVLSTQSGVDGLALLTTRPDVAVVISDMQMPGMNGAEFLRRARTSSPDALRILLTGQADIESAIAAVNDGQIFRFLTKPCPAPTLLTVLDSAIAQRDLIQAERVLLEQTLRGSIQALTDILALSNPAAFGRGVRIREIAEGVAKQLALTETWPIAVAAMLSQLGMVALPLDTAERLYNNQPISEAEQAMVARSPVVVEQLLARIPRLEVVRELLHRCGLHQRQALKADDSRREAIALSAAVLRVSINFDALTSRGRSATEALEVLHSQGTPYPPAVLAAVAAVNGSAHIREVRAIRTSALEPGLELADDVRNSNGTLLVSRGFVITAGFIERIRNFPPDSIAKTVSVVVRQ